MNDNENSPKRGRKRSGRKVKVEKQTKVYTILQKRKMNVKDLYLMMYANSPRTCPSLTYVQNLVSGKLTDIKGSALLIISDVLNVPLEDIIDRGIIKHN
jgi:DNA-binding Xre family transcriptional regulator